MIGCDEFLTKNKDRSDQGAKQNIGDVGWYLIGVGGCGCNIVDDLLQRQEIRKKGASQRSESGIFDWWVFNTNIADLKMMKTLREMNFENDALIADRYIIAPNKHKWIGAGSYPEDSAKWMKYYASKDSAVSGFYCRLDYVLESLGGGHWNKAQGVLVVHGVGKGTGCGATPVLIEYLKNKDPATVVFTATILPFQEELDIGGSYAYNALYGLAKVCETADSVFLVSNSLLEQLTGKEVPRESATVIDDRYDVQNQRIASEYFRNNINPPMLNFIETLTAPSMNSYPTSAIGVLDIRNFLKYNSINGKNGLLVPLYYDTVKTDVSIEVLLEALLSYGQLSDCRPETATGIYIFLIGDLKKYRFFKGFSEDSTAIQLLLSKIRKEIQRRGFTSDVDIRCGFVASREKRLRVLMLLANPQIPTLLTMYEKARNFVNSERHGELVRPSHKEIFENDVTPSLKRLCANMEMPLIPSNEPYDSRNLSRK